MMITVLTPTFNRGGGLQSLWDSLQKQTVKDFEWLVVDDGSSDGTKNLITQLQEKSDFPVRYIYKNNGGKHTALNVGMHLDICSSTTEEKQQIHISHWVPGLPHSVRIRQLEIIRDCIINMALTAYSE